MLSAFMLHRTLAIHVASTSALTCQFGKKGFDQDNQLHQRLERIGEVWIINETDCFRLEFIEKMERRFRSTTPDMGTVLKRRSNLKSVYS